MALGALTLSLENEEESADVLNAALLLWMLRTAFIQEVGQQRFEAAMARMVATCEEELRTSKEEQRAVAPAVVSHG